jgi:adenosine deaminase
MQHSPKLELHLHIEGAAPPRFIRDLAARKAIDLGGIFDENGHYNYQGFDEFLTTYEAATQVLSCPQDFADLTRAVLEQSALQGVIYTELFISPDFCGGGDLAAWRDYLAAIHDAADQAERDFGIVARGIVTAIRHFGGDAAKPIGLCAAHTQGEFIRGFGIGGDEMAGKLADFKWAYDCAREAGLHLTAHAGEWGGPQSVWDAIHDLGVARVGHGVHAIDDPKLVEYLGEHNIVLEVCPGSNVALGVYPSWRDHPVDRLRKAGVPVTISTDDPPFFHTSMTNEYENLANVFGWGRPEFDQITQTALQAAFCDETTRGTLAERLNHP